jgi:hypothetical protein
MNAWIVERAEKDAKYTQSLRVTEYRSWIAGNASAAVYVLQDARAERQDSKRNLKKKSSALQETSRLGNTNDCITEVWMNNKSLSRKKRFCRKVIAEPN